MGVHISKVALFKCNSCHHTITIYSKKNEKEFFDTARDCGWSVTDRDRCKCPECRSNAGQKRKTDVSSVNA